METHEKEREKQLAGTLLHLSHELQSCPSHGHTVTLLGLLAGGRGPIPAPSAIAGVVSRVGSLERSVEFHENAILELERQGSVVDSLVAKVEEMDQLLAQLEQLSDLVAEVERDTAVRFEQAESLVHHVDGLARRGQACWRTSKRWINSMMISRKWCLIWRVASTILNYGVKSSLRACEVQPPGQGGIKILAAVWMSM